MLQEVSRYAAFLRVMKRLAPNFQCPSGGERCRGDRGMVGKTLPVCIGVSRAHVSCGHLGLFISSLISLPFSPLPALSPPALRAAGPVSLLSH